MKRSSARLLALVFAAMATAMTTGCAVVLIGMGAGAATVAYVMGELTLTYESDYSEAIRASTDTLKALQIAIADRTGDELKTAIAARQPNGVPVEIDIEKIGEKRTTIGVRTGHVGVWDHRTSRRIHDMIGERLVHPPGREGTFAKKDPPPAEPETTVPAHEGTLEPTKKKTASKAVAPAAAVPTPASRGMAAKGFKPDLTIFFASGADDIPPGEIGKLDRIAAALNKSPATVVSLHGFSDASGKATQNFILSVGRADSVKRYLAGKGCPADQVLVIGHGAAKFLGDNDTETGRRLNRRVEVEIHNTH